MVYTITYKSPIGNLLIAAKDNKLIGLWIENQKYYLSGFKEEMSEREDVEVLAKTKKWLDRYFISLAIVIILLIILKMILNSKNMKQKMIL